MNMEKLKEAFSDEAFVKSLFELETASEVQAALKEKDIELSEEEIISIRDFLVKVENGEITKEQLENWAAKSERGELSEEALEAVAGGGIILSIAITIGVLTATYGSIMGIAVGAVDAYKRRW